MCKLIQSRRISDENLRKTQLHIINLKQTQMIIHEIEEIWRTLEFHSVEMLQFLIEIIVHIGLGIINYQLDIQYHFGKNQQ